MTTTQYIGMSCNTGRAITDADHISQSIADILITPVGSRVMRSAYGSLLSELIDQLQNPALRLQIMAASYSAILRWESRVKLLQENAYREVILRQRVNDAARGDGGLCRRQ
ncbi:TPA: GPW/gp25 family protein [Yersinia enterocolitica]